MKIICFSVAVILRLLYLITPILNSDFAVVGLIARHILKGELPVFFYGFHFECPIESYFAAPMFLLFGSSRFVLDCVPAIMALIWIYTIYKLAKTIFGNPTANLALLFSTIAPAYFLTTTTVPMEGYIETGILGAIAFIVTYKIIYTPRNLARLYFLLGLVIGFSFYLHFHIIPFFITVSILLFWNDKKIIFKKYFLFCIIGFLIGNSPLLIYNIKNGWVTFQEIGRGIEHSTFLGTLRHLFEQGFKAILGTWIVIPIYLAGFIYLVLKRGNKLLITFLIIFPITYWLSGRGEVNTRRYLIPLYSITPIVLAYFLNGIRGKNKFLFLSLTGIILGSNIYTNLNSITILNPGKRIQYQAELKRDRELYNSLKTNNIKGAYSLSWWVSLKFNFDFKEDVILNLILDEPYPKYQKIVDSTPNPAFVGWFSELAPTFDSIGGTYKTHVIPSYSIQYDLTPASQTLEEIDNSNWTVYSSHNTETASLSFDRDIATRWHSDTAQRKDMSFTIDLGKAYPDVTRLLYNPGPHTDWPCGYELYTSMDGSNWQCVAKNPACIAPVFWNGPHPFIRDINGLIEIDFPPQPARYLKIVLTKDKERFYWSIAEIFIYRQKDKRQKDWDITKLKERLSQLKPKRVFADPWVTSQIDENFYRIEKDDTIDNNYIYRYFIVKPEELKDCIFIVLQENCPPGIEGEDFGPYKLINPVRSRPAKGTATAALGRSASNGVKMKNGDSPHFYWDGFHLLRCTY